METVRIRLEELEQNTGQIVGLPGNPRQWTKAEVDRIAKSLRETPELFEARPIIVTRFAGKFVILGGNLRYEGCKRNKDKDAPCFILPDDTPVDKMKEIVIKDNGSFGEWDYDALANLWDDLPLGDWGVPAWETETKEEKEVTEDDFDEDKDMVEQRCKPGDVWELGDHRLMCGDSTDSEAVAKLMDGKKADMVFTDPPYGYEYERHIENPRFEMIMNDDKILDFFPQVSSFVRGFVFVCTMWKVLDKWIPLFKKYFPLSNMLIWDKGGGGLGDLTTTFSSDYEIILCSHNKGQITGKRLGSIWRINKDSGTGYSHPTQKPVALSAMAISAVTIEGDSVLDLFGGSGTTLIAAEQLGRKCYMMELDPHYCDVIIARWEKLTGREAVKL